MSLETRFVWSNRYIASFTSTDEYTTYSTQLHVGHSGIRIDAAAGGSAASCMEIMGGLTTDQLRWIYSDLSMSELKGFKWDQNSVPFSDGDDSTHLWSELNENCTAEGKGGQRILFDYIAVILQLTSSPFDLHRNPPCGPNRHGKHRVHVSPQPCFDGWIRSSQSLLRVPRHARNG